ncbi:14.7 kDa ribonuclease H-like protein [Gossypium australe]|uniref:14.7 kDa ribonuclease H-like protein n=1 Tax=Gossypium australe TaxID=47621 RepID=A0A5B6WPF6_9ROSI|nr:14.7 kDa ribonuclease H-like protein [Gossypium australe]
MALALAGFGVLQQVTHPSNNVSWTRLVGNMVKFNVDGSTQDKPRPTGCGNVLRDEEGKIRGMFSSLLGVLDSNLAKLLAIKTALHLFSFICLGQYCDSLVVKTWVCNVESCPWKLWKTFNEIDRLICSINNVLVNRILREANRFPNSLNWMFPGMICSMYGYIF